MLDGLPREANAKHGVEDSLVGDAITDENDLVVEACLQAVDVLHPSQPRNDHECADVDQN